MFERPHGHKKEAMSTSSATIRRWTLQTKFISICSLFYKFFRPVEPALKKDTNRPYQVEICKACLSIVYMRIARGTLEGRILFSTLGCTLSDSVSEKTLRTF